MVHLNKCLTFYLFLLTISAHAQTVHVFTSGSLNDTYQDNFVEIGFKEGATIGLDLSFEEVTVDESNTTKNIISIQRDSQSIECGFSIEEEPISFSESMSLNRDLRSPQNSMDISHSFFQIKLLGEDVEEVIILQPEDIAFNGLIEYIGYVFECGGKDERIIYEEIDMISTFPITFISFPVNNSSDAAQLSSIIIKFEDDLFTSTSDTNYLELEIYPSLVIENINWKLPENDKGIFEMKVYDLLGRLMTQKLIDQESSANMSILNTGQYILQLQNIKSGRTFVSRFQKM